MRNLVILGATGSIGDSTLKIVRQFPDRFNIIGISVRTNAAEALKLAEEFNIPVVSVTDESAAREASDAAPPGVKILSGVEGLEEVAALDGTDCVICAVVGMAGLRPVMAAVKRGIDVALATKEVLVAAGEAVTAVCSETGAKLIPVDSEHSAIYQCLSGAGCAPDLRTGLGDVDKLILTASGGPFGLKPEVDLSSVTVADALNHPRWSMGSKVTIDSATMMNKGLEVMEARWLFDIPAERIDVIIHPESIVHSMVEFVDGSLLAQLSIPDMRFAIQYALTYPERWDGNLPKTNLAELGSLNFVKPDNGRFPCLDLARHAAQTAGTLPVVLNASNEIAVDAFLKEKIKFSDIWKIVEDAMKRHDLIKDPSLDDIFAADEWARSIALETSSLMCK